MRAFDLCAGAGGFSLGLQRAGFDVLGLELDDDAIDTHRRHVGPCEKADLRTYHPTERRDVTAGGVPCQPFSDAGKGLALDDPRYLVPDFLRIAREAGSRAVLLENVRGLVKKPRAFRAVLDLFEAEWLTTWTVLDAADFGVPQHRDRVFVVGFKDAAARARFRWPVPSHAPPGGLFGAPYRTVRQALDLLPGRAFRSGREEGASGWQGQRLLDVDAPGFAIEGGGGAEPLPNRRQRERLGAELEAAGLADRPATTVDTKPTLSRAGRGHRDPQKDGAVRLSVEQCALLQGFPPGWTWTGNKGSQHRQVGNAVPPALAEAMGRAVREALLG